MALKTRIRLLTCARLLISAFALVVFLVAAQIAFGGGEAMQPTPMGMMWEVIVALFGLLNTVLTGVMVWLVSNLREAFQRISRLEGDDQTRKALCDERHKVW